MTVNIEGGPFATEEAARKYVATFPGAKKVHIEKRTDGWHVSFKW